MCFTVKNIKVKPHCSRPRNSWLGLKSRLSALCYPIIALDYGIALFSRPITYQGQPATPRRPLWTSLGLKKIHHAAASQVWFIEIYGLKCIHTASTVVSVCFYKGQCCPLLVATAAVYYASAVKDVFTIAMDILQLDGCRGYSPLYKFTEHTLYTQCCQTDNPPLLPPKTPKTLTLFCIQFIFNQHSSAAD